MLLKTLRVYPIDAYRLLSLEITIDGHVRDASVERGHDCLNGVLQMSPIPNPCSQMYLVIDYDSTVLLVLDFISYEVRDGLGSHLVYKGSLNRYDDVVRLSCLEDSGALHTGGVPVDAEQPGLDILLDVVVPQYARVCVTGYLKKL